MQSLHVALRINAQYRLSPQVSVERGDFLLPQIILRETINLWSRASFSCLQAHSLTTAHLTCSGAACDPGEQEWLHYCILCVFQTPPTEYEMFISFVGDLYNLCMCVYIYIICVNRWAYMTAQ